MARIAGYGAQFGGEGGIGTVPFDTRGTDSLPAIFVSVAARDAYYVANPAEIAAGSALAEQRRSVGIGPTDGDPTGVTSAFIRNDANTGWIPIPAYQGPAGPQGNPGNTGPAGADGIERSFSSVAARDAFYATQANRNDLLNGDVISVNIGSTTVEFQMWVGASQPTAYNANNFVPASLRTSNASINFGDELRIFDWGEIPAFEDMINSITALAIGQRYTVSGGAEKARRLVFPGESALFTTTGTTNSALQAVHEYTIDTTGLITNQAIVTQGTVNFVVAPNFYIIEIWVGTDDTGQRVFRGRFDAPTTGVFTARPPSPQRFLPNTTYFIRLTGDIPFQFVVGDSPGDVAPIGVTTGVEFTFEDLASETFVLENLAGLDSAVVVNTPITITSGNLATYERKFLYVPTAVTGNVTVTISQDLDFDGFSFFVFGTGTLTIAGTGAVLIQGQATQVYSQYQGGRLVRSPEAVDNNSYGVIYDNSAISTEAIQDVVGGMVSGNTETNITVTYDDASGKLNFAVAAGGAAITVQDEGTPLTGSAETLNFTGAGVTASGTGATKTLEIPGSTTSTILNNVFNYSATGTQNIGVDLVGALHILAASVTNFDTLIGTTLTEDGVFGVTVLNTNAVEFDVSASGQTFGGQGSGNAYSMPGNSTTLFYVNSDRIYPLANIAAAAAGQAPLIVARDTPSQATLAALAAASTGGNSALWVVANDQIAATESGVPSAVQIRALGSGLLDANNASISITAVNKSTVVLQRGTQVRIFSSTDLRVVSTPTVRETAARYPDLANLTSSPLNLVGNQSAYNLHRNRTTVLTDAGTTGVTVWEVYLPSLQNAVDLAYLDRNDVFGFRNDRTDTLNFRIRTFQVGTSFSNGFDRVDVAPGQVLYISPAPSGRVWQILEFGQAAGLVFDPLMVSDWYRDETDATAADNSVRLHHRKDIVDGDVRNHIQTVTATNNPITVLFQSRNIQDDIAWYTFWTTFVSGVPPVGVQNVEVIEAEIVIALAYITANINNGQDFQFNDPILDFSTIEAITHVSGNTVRVELFNPLPAHIVINDVININNSAVAANNGMWAIETIAVDRLDFTISIPGASTANNTGAQGFITRTIYADAVLVSHTLRQVNFRIYRDAARTVQIDTFPAGWFSTDTSSVETIFAIAYNNDIQVTGSQLAIQDETEAFFLVKGGPRRSSTSLDNTLTNYVNERTLPINFEEIEIRTDGTANFYLPEYPDQLNQGETRRYTLHSHPDNDDDDVRLWVGDGAGDTITSDEGLASFGLRNGTFVTIELYNQQFASGWRIITPISRTVNSGVIFSAAQTADTAPIAPLPVSLINVLVAQSEDVNNTFFTLPATGPVVLNANADYDFNLSMEFIYTGPVQTGLLFLPVGISTRINGGEVARLSANNQTLLLAQYTTGAGQVVRAATTVHVNISDYQATAGDTIAWHATFGNFPPGVSAADVSVKDLVFSLTAKLRLD